MVWSIRHIASMTWKRNVVLSLVLIRLCGSMSKIDMSFPILITIGQLIRNGDIYERIHPCPGVSHDVINRKNINYSLGPNFQSLCQKYNLLPLRYSVQKQTHRRMKGRITKLYFCPTRYLPLKISNKDANRFFVVA